MSEGIAWEGTLITVQPHIRLSRSFDQRSHTYQGYLLEVQGRIAEENRAFWVAIGPSAQAKHQFQTGDVVRGAGHLVEDPERHVAELHKVSKLKVLTKQDDAPDGPPWRGVPPDLPVYRERGHRRLAAKTYETTCGGCHWGARMPVEIIVDHWKPSQRGYRTETFCYGPLSCPLYRAGPTRKVPGRRGMSWEEEDWVDEQETSHREMDE